jgi:tRNA threonylcarbamoyladenosine biosynthesis protein TsaB
MTILLAIETSTELASVSLSISERIGESAGERIISRDLSGVQTHSQGLLPAVQELFLEAGVDLHQVNALAFGCGPGAFTGTRTACGVVQGLAYGLGISVIPVVSLAIMAETAHAQSGWESMLCLLDARMDEVYWAHYRGQKGQWNDTVAPCLSTLESALDYARLNNVPLVLGNGVDVPDAYADLIFTKAMPHASFAIGIAARAFELGLQLDAAQAQPLYLRNKVAQTTAERQLQRGV